MRIQAMNSSELRMTVSHVQQGAGSRLGICIVALLGMSLSIPVLADDSSGNENTIVDTLQQQVSETVVASADWLDAFFDDPNYLAEDNRTRLRVSFKSFSEDGEGTDFDVDFSLRLALPRFENRMQLIVSGETDNFDTTESDWEDIDDQISGREDESLAVGLRYFFRQSERHNVSLSGGVRFRSGSPVVYVQPRYRYEKPLGQWNVRFIERLGWYSDSGFESQTQLQFERPVGDGMFFRTTGDLYWYQDEDGLYPKLRFALNKPLSEKAVVALQWNNYFETEPDAVLDSSVVKLRYKRQFYREWMSFEVAPQVVFPRDEDYDAVPGIQLKLNVDFGAPN
jgi:hypothetical protein